MTSQKIIKFSKERAITIIAAISENRVLGKDNKLIWHLPEDLKRFKKFTSGHSIIMGRKTFESLPKALPDRHNIVVTKNKEFSAEGVTVCHSLVEAINASGDDLQPFIIGGGQIYHQAIELADKIELTKIFKLFEGDVFFPKIDSKLWYLDKEEQHKHSSLKYAYQTYLKTSK
ncbi:MAG: diacylglycerol kinase [Flavobacteriaceae bacterium]|nr:diacylglycerol kinase [Flavobacteriaceae bacterium]|tara:strand:+ start:491 stop:1009 length:519 start_codon:yes stop_codon:yes gene_type:complete